MKLRHLQCRSSSLDNDCYDQYYHNLKKNNKTIANMYSKNYILSSFDWEKTDEGYNFWFELNKKWLKKMVFYIKYETLSK